MKLTLLGVLTVIFIVLKLVGVITWSWWWVLSPQWISILAFILMALVKWADDMWNNSYF